MVKIRGFTLRSEAKKKLSLAALEDMLSKWEEGETYAIETKMFTMKLSRAEQSVTNRALIKKYSNNTFNKRIIKPGGGHGFAIETVPYGLKHDRYCDFPSQSPA